ncbi:MAG: DUF6371 domain-containing protein [Prevotella sp.]|nr:DUF6371 domain-containing protein [Prevotella sp.]
MSETENLDLKLLAAVLKEGANSPSEYFGRQTEVLRPIIPFVTTRYSSLTCHLDNLLGDTFVVDLLCYKYLLGAPAHKDEGIDYVLSLPYQPPVERLAVLLRYANGDVVDGNVLMFDESGNILSWKGLFEGDSCDRYWHKETITDDAVRYYKLKGFFGGHLLGKSKDQYIYITHTEIQAMLGYLCCPNDLWLAIGYRQHLTMEHLMLLKNKKNVVFVPDKEMYEDIGKIGLLRGMKYTERFIKGEENDADYMVHRFLKQIRMSRQENQAIFEDQYKEAKKAHYVMTEVY